MSEKQENTTQLSRAAGGGHGRSRRADRQGGVLSETARQEYLADNLDLLEDT